jgi:hypothetical protein
MNKLTIPRFPIPTDEQAIDAFIAAWNRCAVWGIEMTPEMMQPSLLDEEDDLHDWFDNQEENER